MEASPSPRRTSTQTPRAPRLVGLGSVGTARTATAACAPRHRGGETKRVKTIRRVKASHVAAARVVVDTEVARAAAPGCHDRRRENHWQQYMYMSRRPDRNREQGRLALLGATTTAYVRAAQVFRLRMNLTTAGLTWGGVSRLGDPPQTIVR